MIKRRFYKLEHGDRDAPSESSSSSSDFDLEEEEETEDSDEEEAELGVGENEEEENVNDAKVEVKGRSQSRSSPSGYASEDSSANEVNLDSSGIPTSDDDTDTRSDRQTIPLNLASGEGVAGSVNFQPAALEDSDSPSNLADCVVKCKSVYKCKLCPRIVCLTEATLQAHLISKRHARSEKLLKEGRLKCMLNGDGRIEGDSLVEKETPEENAQKSMNKKRGRHGPKKGRNRKGNQVKRQRNGK